MHHPIRLPLLVTMSALTLLAACEPAAPPTGESTPAAAPASGIDTTGFDTTVRPQDDFYQYVNGTWLATTEIPADKSNYGAFSKLADEAEAQLRAIVEETAQLEAAAPGSTEQKIRDFYTSYMDEKQAEALGLTPLAEQLAMIDAIDGPAALFHAFGVLDRENVQSPIGGGIFSDQKNPDIHAVYFAQNGLTLPDRDYYLKDDERFAKARDLYLGYATALLTAAGHPQPDKAAAALLALETRIAEVQWSREENRDPNKRYNPMPLARMLDLAPAIGWQAVLDGYRIPARDEYIVSQPSYFEGLNGIVADTPLDLWQAYLVVQLLDSYAPALNNELFKLWFAFQRQGLQGQEEPRPRWKRAIADMDDYVGELLGRLYVARHFKPDAKARMTQLIDNLIAAYRESIGNLEWMSEATRQKALEKLASFRPKIGYPDEWKDYSALEIKAGDLAGNIRRARLWQTQRQIDRLDEPVDKNEWFMTPQTINAYYNPLWNEIVFPAAILQPPFFDVGADDAVNYGGIGAVIGHEIGHGFDDQGRKFAADGSLTDWWTEADAAEFEQRKNKLAAQYDAFVAIDDLTVNGQFTSGENIGDLGGLSIAHLAWQLSLAGREPATIDGLSGEQRFFMGWAQIWRRLYRDEELRRRLVVDPHSPSKARTNVVLPNLPAFHEAFGTAPGDGMYLEPEERVKIW